MRRVLKTLGLVLSVALLLTSSMYAYAQTPGQNVFQSIAADLSQRTGRQVSFDRMDGFYQFEEIRVSDDFLGCPGGLSAPGVTRAWKIEVTLNNVGVYDYRATFDGTVIFLCSGTGIGAPSPLVTAQPAQPTTQPATASEPTQILGPVLAYIGASGDVYVLGISPDLKPVALTADANPVYDNNSVFYSAPSWSPDGQKLAYRRHTLSGGTTLWVSASGQPARQVAASTAYDFDITWSADSNEVIFAVPTQQPNPIGGPSAITYQIQGVNLVTGQLRLIANIAVGVGCGGGGVGPSMARYFEDVGYQGHGRPLYVTDQGVIHTVDCTGESGFALTRFDGQRAWMIPQVARASLSPDMARLLALQVNPGAPRNDLETQVISAVLIDVRTGAVMPIALPYLPSQIAWSTDGQGLIFSTRTPGPIVPLTRQGDYMINQAQSFGLALWSVPLTGGTPTQLYGGEGGFIGRISVTRATAIVAFTVIDSDVALVNAINAGQNNEQVQAASAKSHIVIGALKPTQGYPFMLPFASGQPALSPVANFLAIPVSRIPVGAAGPGITGPATAADNPLGLVIGGKAMVPAGGNVNVRANPAGTAAILGIVRPGDTVTILAGPILESGFRWWQTRRDTDGLIGWISDVDRQNAPNLVPVR